MAAPTINVFGVVVTGETRVDRALKAREDPNAGGKRDQEVAYIREQKKKFGVGVSTLCIFYNATGTEPLSYVDDASNHGEIYDVYPPIVENGQWGAFLHVKKSSGATGSEGFVMYRGKYNDTDYCKHLIAWVVPWDQLLYNNHAFCEIYDDKAAISKSEVYKKLEASRREHSATNKGIYISSSIEKGTSPLYDAQFTIEA